MIALSHALISSDVEQIGPAPTGLDLVSSFEHTPAAKLSCVAPISAPEPAAKPVSVALICTQSFAPLRGAR